jgi:hypothetical protein
MMEKFHLSLKSTFNDEKQLRAVLQVSMCDNCQAPVSVGASNILKALHVRPLMCMVIDP